MTKLEVVQGYEQLGVNLTVIKEEHSELGDIFYVSPSRNVSVKALTATVEDIKIVLGVKELVVLPDYTAKAIKIVVGSSNSDNVYAERLGVVVEADSLTVPLGANTTGVVYHTFSELPHLLVAGSTGSGKSFFLHQLLTSLITTNSNISIVPIDFKGTELVMYGKFVNPVLGSGYGTTLKDAYNILGNATKLMNTRYVNFKAKGVSDIREYNKTRASKIDHIFIVVDELADLMLSYSSSKEESDMLDAVKSYLIQLAQKARGAGIHLILSTQRPTVDVISGHIKANIVSRVALRTSTAMESKIILDENGAEGLSKGGFLYKDFDTTTNGRSFKVSMDAVKSAIAAKSYTPTSEYAEIKGAQRQESLEQAIAVSREVSKAMGWDNGKMELEEAVLEKAKALSVKDKAVLTYNMLFNKI